MWITVESYIDGIPEGPTNLPDEVQQLRLSPALLGKMRRLSPNQIGDLIIEGLASLGGGRRGTSFVTDVSDMAFFEKLEYGDVLDILELLGQAIHMGSSQDWYQFQSTNFCAAVHGCYEEA